MQEVKSGKTKKRQRKDLSVEEIHEIVAATNEPYRTQKDVALKYQISPLLVCRLVKDAERRPEKFEKLQRKRDLKE